MYVHTFWKLRGKPYNQILAIVFLQHSLCSASKLAALLHYCSWHEWTVSCLRYFTLCRKMHQHFMYFSRKYKYARQTIFRYSTCPLVLGCWELSQMIFLKLRRKVLLAKLSKFTIWWLFSLKTKVIYFLKTWTFKAICPFFDGWIQSGRWSTKFFLWKSAIFHFDPEAPERILKIV